MMDNIYIQSLPTQDEPKPEATSIIDRQKRVLVFKFPWRISKLALPKPRKSTKKYLGEKPQEDIKPPRIIAETAFYSDQIARPFVRQRLRDQRKRKLDKIKAKKNAKALEKQKKEKAEHISHLAQPKPLHLPPVVPKKPPRIKIEDMLIDMGALAQPKSREDPPTRDYTIIPEGALTYEITEGLLKLHQLPERIRNLEDLSKPLGVVVKSALSYKPTPRIEELARPKVKKQVTEEDEEADRWVISRTALKYKPTPRILELAKPLERD